ncbi:MAG: hypothetical protein ACYDBB_04275 [Armatimonadota bacterium]
MEKPCYERMKGMRGFHKMHGMPHGHGMMRMKMIPGFPIIPFIFPIGVIVISTVMNLLMFARLVRAAETAAMVDALDEMEDRLSDVEQADLEGRIRENLFS